MAAAVLFACLLALAGCSSMSSETTQTPTADAPTPTDTETLEETTVATETTTSAPDGQTSTTPSAGQTTTPDEEPPADAEQYSPGVTANGVRDIGALVDAHGRQVLSDGATVRASTRVNGTVNNRSIGVVSNETATVTPNATEFRWTVLGTNVQGNETRTLDERYWANESVFVTRVASGENVTVRAQNRSETYGDLIESAVTKTRLLRTTLSNANFTVTNRTQRNGRRLTTLRSVNGSYSDQRPLSDYTARLTVDESGTVRSFERHWRAVTDAQNTTFRARFVWTDTATVRKPSWTSDASD